MYTTDIGGVISTGSLIVTSATGRGIPVFDFIALNQQATATLEILNYFKSKNKGWSGVETVIIDKDFTEWSVLERCFPAAKVLLCQYHAITFWQKILQRKTYNLFAATRDDLHDQFVHMLKRYESRLFVYLFQRTDGLVCA